VLVLSACGGGTSGGGGGTGFITGSDGIATAKKGERADAPDLSGTTIDGEQLDVASAYKGQIVVVNVWGSWCSPCRAEAANLVQVSEDLKDRGVRFVGINTRDTSTEPARAFEDEYKVEYPSLYDPTGKLMLRFEKGTLNPQAIPSTLVIDRDGKIAARCLQALSESKLRKMIDPILAEK
jgi:peroxiredoxin